MKLALLEHFDRLFPNIREHVISEISARMEFELASVKKWSKCVMLNRILNIKVFIRNAQENETEKS